MDIFSRSAVKISDSNLRELVINWTGKDKQSIDIFGKLLQSIGIVTPVTLSNSNEEENSFNCVTSDGKTLSLTLFFGGWDDFPRLIVSEGELSSCYNYWDWDKTPHLELQSTGFQRNNRSLYNYYCKYFCNRNVTLPGDYYVTVNVYEPEPHNENYVRVLGSKMSIENYLLDLTFPCTAQDIYERVMELYGFDDSVVSTIESIKVSVAKIISKDEMGNALKKRTLSAFFMKYGKIYQYVVNEDDVAYSISKNGDWFYSTPCVRYAFSAATNRISVTIEADERAVCAINNAAVIETARKKIDAIRGKIN